MNAGDVRGVGWIPGLGRSPGKGNGNALQYSCLENPKDRGTRWATVHGARKSQTQISTELSNTWIFPLSLSLFCPFRSVQLLSCVRLCAPMDCSTPGFPVHHRLLKHAQTHVHRVGDTIQPSHPLSSPSPPAFSLSQHQGLFQWVSYSHQVAKVLEFQLQHQSFHWIFRTDFL